VDVHPVASGAVLAGGHLLAAISTSIVGILANHWRGPLKGSRPRMCRGPRTAIVAVAFMLWPLRWRRALPRRATSLL
jgi:hypothetical protein